MFGASDEQLSTHSVPICNTLPHQWICPCVFALHHGLAISVGDDDLLHKRWILGSLNHIPLSDVPFFCFGPASI